MPEINITKTEREIVNNILNSTLTENILVYIFGSRAKNSNKKFSDLDIALKDKTKISFAVMADLQEKFDESSLPYKVDIIDLNSITKSFLNCIGSDLVLWE